MTCFSIQKSLIFALAALFFWGFCPAIGHAQQSNLSINAQKGAEDKSREEKEAKKKALEEAKVDSPIVIELFTTSDCTACIYADRMLYDSMKDKNVIALSCHINDLSELRKSDEKEGIGEQSLYQGPMDPCVFRQWTYQSGRTSRDVTINIPNFVFNGYDQVDADSLTYYETMLNAYHYAYKNKVLEVLLQWQDDDTITVNLPQDPNYEKVKLNASVWLIRYKDMAVERIDDGLNKGRVLRFSNIIQDIRHIAKWHGQVRTINVDVPKPEGGKERGGYAIIVAEMMGEPILAAGKLVDYPTAADALKPPTGHAADPNQSPERSETPPPGATGAKQEIAPSPSAPAPTGPAKLSKPSPYITP